MKRFVPSLVILGVVLVTTTLAQTPAEREFAGTYQRWIDEDVVYIATPDERARFLALTDNAARDSFIVQFWEKRNPNPGNPENTFKEEHYRRIAYSNAHFAAGVPGWKTDRGCVYIVNGPPDEIQSTVTPPHPSQVWKYKSGKQFRFVDECDCGQYRISGESQNKGLQLQWLPKN